jgi:hypothetical protein
MFNRMFFKFLSESKQVAHVKEHGVALGTRVKNGRKAYLYMLNNFCVEVLFNMDNDQLEPEKVTTFPSLKDFNNYLEKEFKASF